MKPCSASSSSKLFARTAPVEGFEMQTCRRPYLLFAHMHALDRSWWAISCHCVNLHRQQAAQLKDSDDPDPETSCSCQFFFIYLRPLDGLNGAQLTRCKLLSSVHKIVTSVDL